VPWIVTPTYAGAHDWRPHHIAEAVQRFRNWCRKSDVPCRYTWVAEIQPKRLERTGLAVVHYHLVAWLPVGVVMPFWDRPIGRRKAFWPHGMTNTEPCRTGVGYLMKYLSKLGDQTRFPKGLRLYGIGGLDRDGRAIRSWLNLPQWCKREFGVGDLQRKAGRLVVCGTGQILEPAYAVQRVPFGLVFQKLREVPARFWSASGESLNPGAFSSWPRIAA
jgi:hypothetical protein